MSFEFIYNLIVANKLTILFICLLIYVVYLLLKTLLYEDSSDIFRSNIFRALHILTKKKRHEKKYIQNEIKGKLNLARRKIYKGKALIPHLSKIEWINGEEPSSYLVSDNEFIVRLDNSSNQLDNIVTLAHLISEQTNLNGIRHLIERPLKDSIDITMTKKILRETGKPNIVDHFFQTKYEDIKNSSEGFSEWHKKVSKIDDQGLYERLLLLELDDFSQKVDGLEPKPYMAGEIEYLINYIYRIAAKKEGEDVPLTYIKAHCKVGIILIAKTNKVLTIGSSPYDEAIKINAIDKKVNSFYLIFWDKPHIGIFSKNQRKYRRICNEIKNNTLTHKNVHLHYSTNYSCIDPNGITQSGEIQRYVVVAE